MDESMRTIHTKIKVLQGLHFPCGNFLLVYIVFSHNFSNIITNLRPNMTYNMIKTQFFLHQALDYNHLFISLLWAMITNSIL